MISEYLLSLHGMEEAGMASLLLSFALFLYVVFRAVRADKRHIDAMSRLPLDASDQQPANLEKVQP
jgi:hypothetical protein